MSNAGDHAFEDAPRTAASMPCSLKIGITMIAALIVSAAIGLFALRGTAILIDLSGLTGFGFCS
jgi:hypothetical protein